MPRVNSNPTRRLPSSITIPCLNVRSGHTTSSDVVTIRHLQKQWQELDSFRGAHSQFEQGSRCVLGSHPSIYLLGSSYLWPPTRGYIPYPQATFLLSLYRLKYRYFVHAITDRSHPDHPLSDPKEQPASVESFITKPVFLEESESDAESATHHTIIWSNLLCINPDWVSYDQGNPNVVLDDLVVCGEIGMITTRVKNWQRAWKNIFGQKEIILAG